MATFENIKKRANEIKNAVEPESVTAEDVGMLIGDLAENAEQTKDVLKETTEDVDYGRRRTDNLQETLANIGAEGGTVQNAGSVALAVGTGLEASDAQQAFRELASEVFPLKVEILSQGSNGGSHEVTDAEHPVTPTFALAITRRGRSVASSATIVVENHVAGSGSYSEVSGATIYNGVLTCPTIINSMVYRIAVTQGGQTVALDGDDNTGEYASKLKFSFMNYRYRGAVSANNIPSDVTAKTNYVKQLCQNNTISKELSTSTQLTGKNALAADKCYVFVIPTQSPNLIVKNANSGGTVDNAGSGTFELARVNGTGTVNCKYVIVPASSNAWNFEITN